MAANLGYKTCRKCKKHYPDFYPKCPHCGTAPRSTRSIVATIVKIIFIAFLVLMVGSAIFVGILMKQTENKYEEGRQLLRNGEYAAARELLEEVKYHNDAQELLDQAIQGCNYEQATEAFEAGDYQTALDAYVAAGQWKDAPEQAEQCRKALRYAAGIAAYDQQDADTAIIEFQAAGDWKDAPAKMKMAQKMKSYQEGLALLEQNKPEDAIVKFTDAYGYSDADRRLMECNYLLGKAAMENGDYAAASDYFSLAVTYSDADALLAECSVTAGRNALSSGSYADALKYFQAAKAGGAHQEPRLDDYILLCQAEDQFANGSLAKGIEYYGSISADFKPAEFDVAARRGMLTRLKAFAAVEGTYGSDTYDIKVTRVSGGWIYTNYYPEGSLTDQELTISCKLNADGTVTVTGKATYYYFTGYSYATYFYVDKTKTDSFTMANLTWLPGNYKIDENTTIYLTGAPRIFYQKYSDGDTAVSNVTFDIKK